MCEGCTAEEQAESDKQHRENRGIPYLFLKPSRGAVIGTGESVVIPRSGSHRLGGGVRHGHRPAGQLHFGRRGPDYVFGYMVTIDISDRGGRPEGRSDWFVGKGHNSFAPQGPWIVPKEFYGNPMERLHQQLTIDGVTVQEAGASDMIHSIWS